MSDDPGNAMSKWQDQRAERNRQSVARLTRALPEIFPSAVLSRALARPFVPPTPRLAINSYWRAHPLRADRLARALARKSGAPDRLDVAARRQPQERIAGDIPDAARALSRSANMRAARVFAACAASRFSASAGMSIYGAPVQTGMPPGTAPA